MEMPIKVMMMMIRRVREASEFVLKGETRVKTPSKCEPKFWREIRTLLKGKMEKEGGKHGRKGRTEKE